METKKKNCDFVWPSARWTLGSSASHPKKKFCKDAREVVLLAHAAARPFVAIGIAIVTRDAFIVGAAELLARRASKYSRPPYSLSSANSRARSSRARIVVLQARDVALLPMLLKRVKQIDGPSGAAFEEAKREIRESARVRRRRQSSGTIRPADTHARRCG